MFKDIKMLKLPANLLDDIIIETRQLLSKKIADDFFKPTLHKFLVCKEMNYYVSPDQVKFYSLLSRGAVRALDSFDCIPETRRFLDLLSEISKFIADNDGNKI
jgi:hypothetical protein